MTAGAGPGGGGESGDERLVIYGAGGHGQVVAEAARLAGFEVVGFIDDARFPGDGADPAVLDALDPRLAGVGVHIAIGDNRARAAVTERLIRAGRGIVAVVHPAAWVSPTATLGDGAFVGPLAVVHAHAEIGAGAIVNSAAVVEHHGLIGAFAHVAPGAVLGGGVRVGDRALVGLGSRVLPKISIGDDAVVGAGAVVVDDVEAGDTVLGIPARPRRAPASP